jgi:hypothetical protein
LLLLFATKSNSDVFIAIEAVCLSPIKSPRVPSQRSWGRGTGRRHFQARNCWGLLPQMVNNQRTRKMEWKKKEEDGMEGGFRNTIYYFTEITEY